MLPVSSIKVLVFSRPIFFITAGTKLLGDSGEKVALFIKTSLKITGKAKKKSP